MNSTDPTNDQFAAYRGMWTYFNAALFDGALGEVFLNFSRYARSLGFFSADRWLNAGDQTAHEISLNPDYVKRTNAKDWASTLVHEMAHAWRYEQGNPSRGDYHDTVWAKKMEEIGLMPSATGRPGGRRTGYGMSHYIIPGGAFDRAFEEMPIEYRLPWTSASGALGTGGKDEKSKKDKENKAERKVKLKYSCPSCAINVWGKAGLRLHCDDCDEQLVPGGAPSADARVIGSKAAAPLREAA